MDSWTEEQNKCVGCRWGPAVWRCSGRPSNAQPPWAPLLPQATEGAERGAEAELRTDRVRLNTENGAVALQQTPAMW